MKKLPEGSFVSLKNYEFIVEKAAEATNGFSPVLSYKKKDKILKTEKSPKITRKISESSISSIEKYTNIEPNYPKPVTRDSKPVSKEKTVAEILFEYESELGTNSMLPLQTDIKPNILLTIQQRPFSAGAKTMSVYNKNKAKTLNEIRTSEKFKGKASLAVNTWIDKLIKDSEKSTEKAAKNINRFKRAENKLSNEISELMTKIRSTKQENDKALSKLQSEISSSKAALVDPLSCFTLNGKPVKANPVLKDPYSTEVVVYNTFKAENITSSKKDEGNDLISDDESFINNISSPEDF